MTNLTESPVWHDNINQVELTDYITGGVDGNANLAPKQLADRTQWLKAQAEALAKQLGIVLAIQPSTPNQTTQTNSTGVWKFLSSKSPKLNAYSENPNDEWLIFTSQPIYSYYYKIVFQSDLPKVKRLPYEPYGGVAANAAYTADKFTNRVLVYVARQGEQPDYSKLPLMNIYDSKNPIVVNEAYFEVDEEGKVYFVRGKEIWTGVTDDSSGRVQAERLGIIKSGQVSPEQHWDTYYVFLLDEKADNKLTEEQIKAQQWGTHHIEKVTMCTRWDVGVGAYTVQQGGTTSADTSEGGNMASIEAGT